MIKKCEYCGKEKEYKYPSQAKRFCSYKCSNQYKWEHLRQKAKTIELECSICNKKFNIYNNDYRIKHNKNIYCSKECSNIALKKGKMKECLNCKKEFYTTRNNFCSKNCAYEYKKKNYKHKLYLENGYEIRYINGYNKKGNVKNHRYIMEQYLGRKLKENEVVHHKDENKLNNDISNLEVMTRSEHSKLHRLKEINNGKKLFEYKYPHLKIEEI